MIKSQNNEGRPRGVREGLGAIRSAQDDADGLPRVQKLLSLEARDKSLEAIHFKESVCGRYNEGLPYASSVPAWRFAPCGICRISSEGYSAP